MTSSPFSLDRPSSPTVHAIVTSADVIICSSDPERHVDGFDDRTLFTSAPDRMLPCVFDQRLPPPGLSLGEPCKRADRSSGTFQQVIHRRPPRYTRFQMLA